RSRTRSRVCPVIVRARVSTHRRHPRKSCTRWRSSTRARAPRPAPPGKRSTHEPEGPPRGRIPERTARRCSNEPEGPPRGRIPERTARRCSNERGAEVAMKPWLTALVRLRERDSPSVLVSIVSAKGSVPRGPGTRMVVSADAVDGTIGGGHLEFTATAIARDMLAGATRKPANELRRFPLGASLGQCCGGV